MLTTGSFLPTAELFVLTVDNFSFFYLQLELFLLTVLAILLTVGAFCSQCENASIKGLKGL